MSTLKTNNVQIGQSGTASNNFTWYQPSTPDGTVRLGVGNSGATTADVASVTSAGVFSFNSGYGSVAAAYGCRAWVNFNGTGTVAIRASGNVSSITDNGGTGDYTINFTTAMPDTNYAVMSCGSGAFGASASIGVWYSGVTVNSSNVPLTKTTAAVRVYTAQIPGPAAGVDAGEVYFSVFR